MYTIRPIEPRDYATACAIRNSASPEPVSVEVFAEWCQLDPKRNIHYYHLVAEGPGDVVLGTVIACHNEWMSPTQWYIMVTVAPDARHQRVGSQLYAEGERLARAAGATELLSECEGGAEEAFAWAQRRGFVCDRQRAQAVLDLRSWNAELHRQPFPPALNTRLVAEITEEPLLRALYDFEATTLPDAPFFEPPMASYEKWVKWFVGEERDRTPTLSALAMEGERVVGLSRINLPRCEGQGASQGFTAVRREYRGQGLAQALKILVTEAAQQAGAPHIRTITDEDNPAMLAVNAKLGFQRVPGPRNLRKQL